MKKYWLPGTLLLFFALFTLTNCHQLFPSMINPQNGLCGAVNLSSAQNVLFAQGNNAFFEVRTAGTGLGPYYVANSCGSCHTSDNRGHPFTMLTRFGQADTNGNTFLAKGGPQLQQNCLPGFMPQQIPAGATSSNFIAPITAGVGFLELIPDSTIISFATQQL